MQIEKLTLNKDFTYSFPYGHYAEPQLKVVDGDYYGMIIDILNSGISISYDETGKKNNNLHYTYKILKMWDGMPQEQIINNKVVLTKKDEYYLSVLV
jgi:hypothetical protein